jgi:opacity protein-like surface antigen
MEVTRSIPIFIAALIILFCPEGIAQKKKSEPRKPAPYLHVLRDNTLELWVGLAAPVTHESFTDFWKRGPSAGFGLMSRLSENLKLGFGIEATLFSFRRAAFAERYPDVPVQAKDQTLVHIFLFVRNYFEPGQRFSPYLGGGVGFSRISGAESEEVINGVRKTYYEIPGFIRLALGLSVGADYYFTMRFAVQGEVRAVYLHRGPNLGLVVSFRGGVKLKI